MRPSLLSRDGDRSAATVGGVLHGFVRHPLRTLVWRWNWKSAILSSLSRATIFFFTNLSAGFDAATGAFVAEFVYRATCAGFYGAMTEGFRGARPAWLASVTAMMLLPTVAHSVEGLLHWWRATPNLAASLVASVAFTVGSTLFNLFAMRRGVLIVGPGRRSLRYDLVALPGLLYEFGQPVVRSAWRAAGWALTGARDRRGASAREARGELRG